MKTVITRILCKNDVNGNPRRGWLATDKGRTFFVQEDYSGDKALRDFFVPGQSPTEEDYRYALSNTTAGPEINVTPAEFKRLAKEYPPSNEAYREAQRRLNNLIHNLVTRSEVEPK